MGSGSSSRSADPGWDKVAAWHLDGEATLVRPERPSLIVLPFRWNQGDPRRLTLILDELVARPQWMNIPMSSEDLRGHYAHHLTNPANGVFEVWQGGTLVGILTLHGIVPGMEAVLHFVFFDGNLVGKRTLLKQFIAKCFRDFHFRRLVMQIPEDVETLIRFARAKLGFRYEGEAVVTGHPALAALGMENPHVWIARQGSRKEQAHWSGDRWVDVIRLRLLASECEERM